MVINNLKHKFNDICYMLSPVHHTDELTALDSLISKIHSELINNYYLNKINSDEWPVAADAASICSSDMDRIARASAIYSLFIASKLPDPKSNQKFLDFGCGEGHVVKCAHDSGVGTCVGYDIVQNWKDDDKLTTDIELVKSLGPYNLILLYDVLDHIVDGNPIEVLETVKDLLSPSGRIVIRCHPWCSRHGSHHWTFNKAYAHLIFTEEELAAIGHKGIPTIKIIKPNDTYRSWFESAGLRILFSNRIAEQCGPIFENNPLMKNKVLSHYNENNINYSLIEDNFIDYTLEPYGKPVTLTDLLGTTWRGDVDGFPLVVTFEEIVDENIRATYISDAPDRSREHIVKIIANVSKNNTITWTTDNIIKNGYFQPARFTGEITSYQVGHTVNHRIDGSWGLLQGTANGPFNLQKQ